MTPDPAAPVPVPPAPATPPRQAMPGQGSDGQARTDALSAAVAAIARRLTAAEPGREQDALIALGLTRGQAAAITGSVT